MRRIGREIALTIVVGLAAVGAPSDRRERIDGPGPGPGVSSPAMNGGIHWSRRDGTQVAGIRWRIRADADRPARRA